MQNASSPFRPAPLAALALIALVAGCKPQPTTLVGGGPADPTANQVAAAPPVKLPPAVMSTKTFRCQDNSLLYVDFMNDNTTANLKKTKDGDAIPIVAPEAGKPYVGGGYTVSGSGDSVSITEPGKSAQPCNG